MVQQLENERLEAGFRAIDRSLSEKIQYLADRGYMTQEQANILKAKLDR